MMVWEWPNIFGGFELKVDVLSPLSLNSSGPHICRNYRSWFIVKMFAGFWNYWVRVREFQQRRCALTFDGLIHVFTLAHNQKSITFSSHQWGIFCCAMWCCGYGSQILLQRLQVGTTGGSIIFFFSQGHVFKIFTFLCFYSGTQLKKVLLFFTLRGFILLFDVALQLQQSNIITEVASSNPDGIDQRWQNYLQLSIMRQFLSYR